MTCVVGVQGDGFAVIGADSAGVIGWTVERRADEKVFRRGAFLFGIAGSFRMGNVLRWSFDAPDQGDVGDEQYIHTAWLDALREAMKARGYAKQENNVESLGGGSFLVAYHGRLYEVDCDYQIGRTLDGYHAVGSGAAVALGALAVMRGHPRRRVLAALEAAEKHNIGVRGPFVTLRSEAAS